MNGSVNRLLLGKAVLFTSAALAAILSSNAIAELKQIDSIVAIVNNDVVLQSEVDRRYESLLMQLRDSDVPASQHPPKRLIEARILDRLILESIQLQLAEERGVVVDDQTLNQAIGTYAEQNGRTVEDLRTQLAKEGIPYPQFREDLRKSIIMQRVQRATVDRLIFISAEEVATFRNTPAFQEYASDQYRLGHIRLVLGSDKLPRGPEDLETKANNLVKQLREGADFAGLAIRHSESSTALEGGDLGWRKLSEVPTLFVEQVRDLKSGETADPIHSGSDFHIVQVLERKGAELAQEERWHIRHILVKPSTIKSLDDAKEEVTDIRARIVSGEDFAELAKEFSDDPGSALVGGDLGWADIAAFVPEFQKAVREAELNELTQPFQTQFGWHLLEVLGQRMEDMSEEKLDDIALNLLYNRFYSERLEEWLTEIRDEAFVVVVDETVNPE